MKVTNKHNLPAPLVNLLSKREYSRGDSIISATQLINSPRIVALHRLHGHKIVDDISDRFWALMGTNIHKILEDGVAEDHIPEERLFLDVEGWRISGQIDVQSVRPGVVKIHDWKFTSVMSLLYPKKEWEHQLNLYAYLVKKVKGLDIEEASVCAILRDWRRSDYQKRKTKNYPPAPMVMVPQKLWTFDEQEVYVRGRVKAHQEAMAMADWGDELPPCTSEDRWLNKGRFIRCEEDYCGVAQWCSMRNHPVEK